MNRLFARRRSQEPGWLAMSMQAGRVSFVHGVGGVGAKCAIRKLGTRNVDLATRDLERLAKELEVGRYQCLTLLSPSDYQLLLVETPNVPAAELKNAVRWRIKDMIDYHVQDATVDVLDIPTDAASGGRQHAMYAVAARNEIIQRCIEQFDAARIPLKVIDIAETAQRNIAALFEQPGRGLAFLYVGAEHALLTVNFRGELYLARRIDATVGELAKLARDASEDMANRVLLELQRSFDHLDRQYPFVNVAKLVLGPEPEETGLVEYLRANLGLPVEQARLESVLDFAPDAIPSPHDAWRLFPVLGAALRHETKTL